MMQLVTASVAPVSQVAPQVISMFLTCSIFDWRIGGLVKGRILGNQIPEEPVITVYQGQAWAGCVRPEGARLRVTPEGRQPFYVPADQADLYQIRAHKDDDSLLRYDGSVKGIHLYTSPGISHLSGLTASQMEGLGWSRALTRLERERTMALWFQAVYRQSHFHNRYQQQNVQTGAFTNCRTIAALERQTGKLPLYRGIIIPE